MQKQANESFKINNTDQIKLNIMYNYVFRTIQGEP